DPADGQALLPGLVDLHRHLVGGPADALGAHLHRRLDVLHRLGEDLDRLGVGHALLDLVQRPVEDAHGGGLLAPPPPAVDELAGQLRAVPGVRLQGLGTRGSLSHGSSLARLAQLTEGSGIGRTQGYGRTRRTVPLGSKNSWLTCPQPGQGTLTEATGWAARAA